MSIRIEHGSAAVSLDDVVASGGAVPSYAERDLLDAAAAALLAVNSLRATDWAGSLYRLAAGQFPIGWATYPAPASDPTERTAP